MQARCRGEFPSRSRSDDCYERKAALEKNGCYGGVCVGCESWVNLCAILGNGFGENTIKAINISQAPDGFDPDFNL